MYCNHCGKVIQDDANLCGYCGRQIGVTRIAQKKLVRSRLDRKIAGVCAGFGIYADLDVTLVRLLWVVVSILSGIFPGVVAYIVAWIIMPEEMEILPPVGAVQRTVSP